MYKEILLSISALALCGFVSSAQAQQPGGMESDLASCEAYHAENGIEVSLSRPPDRPTEDDRAALEECFDNGVIARRGPPPGERGPGGRRGGGQRGYSQGSVN